MLSLGAVVLSNSFSIGTNLGSLSSVLFYHVIILNTSLDMYLTFPKLTMTESVLLLWVLIIFTVYTNIELIWLMIKSVLYHAMCLYTPKTRLRSRQDPQWFDSSIRHQINCLNTLCRKSKSHPLLEQQLQQHISSAKSNFESQLLMSLRSNSTSKVFRCS
jgi:hypothetical protein